MVDRIRGVTLDAARPRLLAVRYVSANEPSLGGHFPGLAMVPGVITVEGLAQACGLLGRIVETARTLDGDLLAGLANLERGATLHPGFDRDAGQRLAAWLRERARLHVVGATSIKLLRPIFPGCRLDHHVELTRQIGDGWRFQVRTEVDGAPVAEGTLGASTISASWPP